MRITFWKGNLLTGEHKVTVEKIIEDHNKTLNSKLDMPFERLILVFMADSYGSFDVLSDEEWEELRKENRKQR